MQAYDFNCRDSSENLFVDSPVVSTRLEAFLQEIDIVLSTEVGTVMGLRFFGSDTEHLLWKTTYDANAIAQSIGRQIEENCLAGAHFRWRASFSVVQGTSRDIGLLDVEINDIETNTPISKPRYIFR